MAHDLVTTSMRHYVASTSFRRRVPNRFFFYKSVPNNYISYLKLLYYRKFKDRIERNSFAGTGGWSIRGGGQRVCWPPSQIIGGGGGAGPPGPPSSYAYAGDPFSCISSIVVTLR